MLVIEHVGINGPRAAQVHIAARRLAALYVAVKNRLARLAFANAPCAALAPHLVGPTALVVAPRNPDVVLCGFASYLDTAFRDRLWRDLYDPRSARSGAVTLHPGLRPNADLMTIRAAWLEGHVLTAAQVVDLVAAGGVRGLRAQLLAVLAAGPQRLLAALQHASHHVTGQPPD